MRLQELGAFSQVLVDATALGQILALMRPELIEHSAKALLSTSTALAEGASDANSRELIACLIREKQIHPATLSLDGLVRWASKPGLSDRISAGELSTLIAAEEIFCPVLMDDDPILEGAYNQSDHFLTIPAILLHVYRIGKLRQSELDGIQTALEATTHLPLGFSLKEAILQAAEET